MNTNVWFALFACILLIRFILPMRLRLNFFAITWNTCNKVGVCNWSEYQLRQHRWDGDPLFQQDARFIVSLLFTPYLPSASTPTWKKFLLTPTNKGSVFVKHYMCRLFMWAGCHLWSTTVHGRYELMLITSSAMVTNPARPVSCVNEGAPCYGAIRTEVAALQKKLIVWESAVWWFGLK